MLMLFKDARFYKTHSLAVQAQKVKCYYSKSDFESIQRSQDLLKSHCYEENVSKGTVTSIFAFARPKDDKLGKRGEISSCEPKVPECRVSKTQPNSCNTNSVRRNPLNIEMLPEALFTPIFGHDKGAKPPGHVIDLAKVNLKQHDLLDKIEAGLTHVPFPVPPLKGKNIEEHFHSIAEAQSAPYRKLICAIVEAALPDPPISWSKKAGWTKYEVGKEPVSVPYPTESALILDVEQCLAEGFAPTLATAVSCTAWYSWVSKPLAEVLAGELKIGKGKKQQYIHCCNLINLESHPNEVAPRVCTQKPKVIIGHNVPYDRSKIKEQYWSKSSSTRFIDTMSMHVAVSGVTSYQKTQLAKKKCEQQLETTVTNEELWCTKSSLNSLSDVHQLYCQSYILDKATRDIFVTGTLSQIAEKFDEVTSYCAQDVRATHEVLCELFPMFLSRFPHPATLAGILELSVAYLPVDQSWLKYLQDTRETSNDMEAEVLFLLAKQANDACRLLHGDAYKQDPWLWDQDWSTQELSLKASKKSYKEEDWDKEDQDDPSAQKFRYLVQQKALLPARRLHLPGYPAWYRKLCPKVNLSVEDEEFQSGPSLIGASMHVAPKLLRLAWDGYPLHKTANHGWGLLIPGRGPAPDDLPQGPPLQSLAKVCPKSAHQIETCLSKDELEFEMEHSISKTDFYSNRRKVRDSELLEPLWYKGTGVWCPDVKYPGCWFRKLPHPEGVQKRVGNPLAREFITRLSEGTLTGEGAAETILKITNAVSYWRNNHDRIESQQVVWLENESLPRRVKKCMSQESAPIKLGSIVPQLQVCGTLTRRVVERTWLTASNAVSKRVGSELRAMIRAPPSYHFVGADVDSQELWIAALLGDAYFAQLHGSTVFGWRTLQGNKNDGTDLHSVTAKTSGMSRQHAKVLNYARIYGAGTHFTKHLLKRFIPLISDKEANKIASDMMTLTKGKRMYRLSADTVAYMISLDLCKFSEDNSHKAFDSLWGYFGTLGDLGEVYLTQREFSALVQYERNYGIRTEKAPSLQAELIWQGGTESAMFNSLEAIANSDDPCTPFLGARLSRSLEPRAVGVNNYVPTRVNWVVQSSAVDFLHLMLVSMRWLLGSSTDWRFLLSFHDEVRYMVPSERKYEAAMALHATNLLVRAFCARRLGIHDLPHSVAFFSAIEIDLAMRKDATNEYQTPSNQHGLSRGHGVPPGETLDIYETVRKVGPDFKFHVTKN